MESPIPDRVPPRRLQHLLAIGVITAAFSAAGHAPAAESVSKPKRIVSINLCTDELVLRLVDRSKIASVTWLSGLPESSNVVSLAAGIPVNHGLAEEIIPLDPDLVVAGIYTARAAVAMLKRTRIPVMEIEDPHSIEGIGRQYIEMADVFGVREKGERIAAEISARLAKLDTERPARRPRAIVLNPNGYTVGEGTLANDIISRAGLENVAATLKMAEYGQIPLETVVMQGVEVLIVSSSRDRPAAMATEILKHPVLSKIADRTRVIMMPTPMWTCAGPAVVDAVELLMNVAKEVSGKARRE
jgi:iron complex transport system substrate-binding protein